MPGVVVVLVCLVLAERLLLSIQRELLVQTMEQRVLQAALEPQVPPFKEAEVLAVVLRYQYQGRGLVVQHHLVPLAAVAEETKQPPQIM